MLTTKNIVRSLVGLSIASGWASAQTTCCPKASIVHAKLSDDTTSWGRRLTETVEAACTTNRAAYISAWPVTDEWVTQGGADFVETDFTRYVRDFGLNAQYWTDADGAAIAKGAKVIVIDADIAPTFVNVWKTGGPGGTDAEYCSSELKWSGQDMAAGLAENAAYFVVRAPAGAALDGWNTWLGDDWAAVVSGSHCGNLGCRVAVQENTGDFHTDVHNALVTIGAVNDPFVDCEVCASTTSTTTTVSDASHVSAGVVSVASVGFAALALTM